MSENTDNKKLEKDISRLNEIIKLAAELQDKLSRYNARQKGFQALYGMDNIVSTIWVTARNLRDSIKTKRHYTKKQLRRKLTVGERVNGVLYLDRIPGKTFSKQLVLDVAEWNFSTHVYCGFPHDVNTLKVFSRVSKEDAKELEKWFVSYVTSSCVEGDYAKGTFCTFFNSGKIQCRIDIDMIHPFQFSQENWNEYNDKETESSLVKMELRCRGLTVVERTVSPTPLCKTSFPFTEVFQIELTDSKTGETVYELYKSMDDVNTRISEIGENNITVKKLTMTRDVPIE